MSVIMGLSYSIISHLKYLSEVRYLFIYLFIYQLCSLFMPLTAMPCFTMYFHHFHECVLLTFTLSVVHLRS